MINVNPIQCEIDLEAEGHHVGFLRLPHSVHRSAYGWLPIPIASIRNGEGPTVIVMAGNHGDEYEGQIIVSRLIRELDPSMITGQLILLPMANFPAAEAGTRTSPLDNGNLNRSFPGSPSGTPTEIIAHYIEHTLLARAQYVVDLHSGGSSLLYDGANILVLDPRDGDESKKLRGILEAFGLPKAFFHDPNPVTISSAARRQGAISIITELGGAGMVNPMILEQAMTGLLNLLSHVGLLSGALVPDAAPAKTRFMRIDASRHYVYAREIGLFEPCAELGQRVEAGALAARIHFPNTPQRLPEKVFFEGSGTVICKRVPAQVRIGDCLFQLGEEVH